MAKLSYDLQGGARNVIPLIVHVTFFLLQKHLKPGTELILIGLVSAHTLAVQSIL